MTSLIVSAISQVSFFFVLMPSVPKHFAHHSLTLIDSILWSFISDTFPAASNSHIWLDFRTTSGAKSQVCWVDLRSRVEGEAALLRQRGGKEGDEKFTVQSKFISVLFLYPFVRRFSFFLFCCILSSCSVGCFCVFAPQQAPICLHVSSVIFISSPQSICKPFLCVSSLPKNLLSLIDLSNCYCWPFSCTFIILPCLLCAHFTE